MNRSVSFLVIISALLAACTTEERASGNPLYQQFAAGRPLTIFHKAGATFDQIRDNELSCMNLAMKQVPVLLAQGTRPTLQMPSTTTCLSDLSGRIRGSEYQANTSTSCTHWQGQSYGGTFQYDANTSQRRVAALQCMSSRGFVMRSIPPCPRGVDLSSQDNELTLRPFSLKTCYTVEKDTGIYRVGGR